MAQSTKPARTRSKFGARRFAKMDLFSLDSDEDELKPIRRPLPYQLPIESEDEVRLFPVTYIQANNIRMTMMMTSSLPLLLQEY